MTQMPRLSLHSSPRSDLIGTSLTWLSGGALALQILMVLGLLALLIWNGLGHFWQREVVELTFTNGTRLAGEIHDQEPILDHAQGKRVLGERIKLKVGNRDLYGQDFRWIDLAQVSESALPVDLVVFERLEYGNFYGQIVEVRDGESVLARGQSAAWATFQSLLPTAHAQRQKITALEQGELSALNRKLKELRLDQRRLELRNPDAETRTRELARIAELQKRLDAEYQARSEELRALRVEHERITLLVETADRQQKRMPLGQIVHAHKPNAMTTWDRLELWGARVFEFVSDDPRESNTEGGIFPPLFGTVLMVFLMTFVVTPLGVLAALYLREYAKQGAMVRLVRIAVNNLAGVPSIVFGVFGLGFFVYTIGGSIDSLFYPEALPIPTFGTGGILWAALTLALLTVPVVIVATEEGLSAVPRAVREGSFALGATKLETTLRVVLPAAAPGILTGMILAIARAAGEVAPLMIVGVVKLAPLPVDSSFPFLHLESKFMHLGFHIYDVGFQSPNVEATKPLVYATALLLVVIVTTMNLAAIWLRNHLRRKYATSAV